MSPPRQNLKNLSGKLDRNRAEGELKHPGMSEAFKHSRHIGLDDIGCFVCAPTENNAKGLHLEFTETAKGAQTIFRLPSYLQSYPGFLHGGIVCSILDETMGYAGVFRWGTLPLTRTLKMSYRRAVEADKEYLCRAEITSISDAGYSATAALSYPGRGSLVLAEAEFIRPTKEQAKRLMPGTDGQAWFRYFR
jgi:acyl-coenzyme A thioesterase PaaI-like protein